MVKNSQPFIKPEDTRTFQLMIVGLWGGTLSNLVHCYQSFRRICCLHHEGKAFKRAIFL